MKLLFLRVSCLSCLILLSTACGGGGGGGGAATTGTLSGDADLVTGLTKPRRAVGDAQRFRLLDLDGDEVRAVVASSNTYSFSGVTLGKAYIVKVELSGGGELSALTPTLSGSSTQALDLESTVALSSIQLVNGEDLSSVSDLDDLRSGAIAWIGDDTSLVRAFSGIVKNRVDSGANIDLESDFSLTSLRTIEAGLSGSDFTPLLDRMIGAASSEAYFYVNYTETQLNNPVVSASTTSTSSLGDATLTKLSPSGSDLTVGVRASSTEFVPSFGLSLRHGPDSSGNISGVYNAVVYGLADSGARVAVAQYSMDFSSETVSINTVEVAKNASEFTAMMPDENDTMIMASQGSISWGGWIGAVSQNGNTMLLTKGKTFLLASKTPESVISLAQDSYTYAFLFQFDLPSQHAGSAQGVVTFTETQMSSPLSNSNISAPVNSLITFGNGQSRYFAQGGTNSSMITLYDSSDYVLNQTTPNEQGFVGSEEFFVILNPDNAVRPSLSIGFLND